MATDDESAAQQPPASVKEALAGMVAAVRSGNMLKVGQPCISSSRRDKWCSCARPNVPCRLARQAALTINQSGALLLLLLGAAQ